MMSIQYECLFYDFDNYRLDVEKKLLLKDGQPVQLTQKAFQILLLLVQNSGQITEKEEIFNKLWTDSFVEGANLTQHIYVLRKILDLTPNGKPYIETIPKRGYRFALPPEQISKITTENQMAPPLLSNQSGANSSVENKILKTAPSLTEIKHAEENNLPEKTVTQEKALNTQYQSGGDYKSNRISRKHLFFSVVILFSGLMTAVYSIYYLKQTAAPTPEIKSIAVLPFKLVGEEIDQKKLGFGMADAIITRLSKLQQIAVRPTSSIFRFVDQPTVSTVSAGHDLVVDAVLEGTIQVDGERMRVAVQLVRVNDGKTLWAESFNDNVSDIFAVQESISLRVANSLVNDITLQQKNILSQSGTTNLEAFQSYQLGVYFWNRRNREDLLKAVQYFGRATEYDSNYAQAYAGLADSYSMLAYYRFADEDEMKEKAKIAAEKALALNGTVAEAYVALAMAYIIKKENFVKAEELLERAVALNPYSTTARHRYGWILLSNGRLDEGVREIGLAREYDPLSPAANRAYCSVLVMQRNFPDAVKQCETTIDIYLHTPNSRRALARAYFFNGRHADAFNQLEFQINSGTKKEVISARGEMAYYYAKLGRAIEAEKIYMELRQEFKKEPDQASDLTLLAFALGKKDEALFYFKEMLNSPDTAPDSYLSLAYDPYWDEIKSDPQFAPLFPK